jgi:hypothetical protein
MKSEFTLMAIAVAAIVGLITARRWCVNCRIPSASGAICSRSPKYRIVRSEVAGFVDLHVAPLQRQERRQKRVVQISQFDPALKEPLTFLLC